MMYGNAQALEASSWTRHQMGHQKLAGPRYVMNGMYLGAPIDKAKLASIGADAANTFLASGFDVDALYEPAYAALNTLALAIPPPGNVIAGVGINVAKTGTDAIRTLMKVAFRAAGQYLPLEVSNKVCNAIAKSPADWWGAAARDKFSEAVQDSILVGIAVAGWNKVMPKDQQLNVTIRSRFADKIYTFAQNQGATPWQAAMVAYKCAANTAALEAKVNYAGIVGDVANPEAAWKKKVGQAGGFIADAKSAEEIEAGSGGSGIDTNTMLIVGAAGVAALLLLSRRKGAPSA